MIDEKYVTARYRDKRRFPELVVAMQQGQWQ